MKMCKLSGWLAAILVLLAAAGCTTPRTLGYLNDMQYDVDYPVMQAPELTVQVEDKLNIQVLSENAQLSAPFNTLLTLTDLASQTAQQPILTYTVNREGNIIFPVLGTLHVEGMTLDEIEKMIAAQIIARGYIKEPMVNVALENFSVIVIGERHSMIVRAEDRSFNLLQAVATFGGANLETVNMKEVTVIRNENGVRRAYAVNLKSRTLFDSPVYYLQQNDIIYVKHRGSDFSQGFRNIWQSVGMITSFASLAVSILTYLALTK